MDSENEKGRVRRQNEELDIRSFPDLFAELEIDVLHTGCNIFPDNACCMKGNGG